ncbi:MAG: nucleotidyltransferase family protein [Chloroflexota bacterium]
MPRQTRLQKFMEILRQQRPMLAEQYNVATLEIFGSYVRHEQRKDSDLDILVTFDKPPSLFKFVRLENHLSDTLGVKVDLVMKDSLKPAIGKHILREALSI